MLQHILGKFLILGILLFPFSLFAESGQPWCGYGQVLEGASGIFSGAVQATTVGTCADGTVLYDINGVQSCISTSDAATTSLSVLGGEDAYELAASNITGGNINFGAGQGTSKFTGVTQANCSTDTLTVTIDNVANNLVEGTDWDCLTDDNTCATALKDAITALSGVTASCAGGTTCTSNTVGVAPDATTKTVAVSTSDDCATPANGTDGYIDVWSGIRMQLAQLFMRGNRINIDSDSDSYIYPAGDDDIRIATNNDLIASFTNNQLDLSSATTNPSIELQSAGRIGNSDAHLAYGFGATNRFLFANGAESIYFTVDSDGTFNAVSGTTQFTFQDTVELELDLKLQDTTVPTCASGHGCLWVESDGTLHFRHGTSGDEVVAGIPVFRSFSHTTGSSGTHYMAGYYFASAADANLTQASPTVTLGTANVAHAAHAFVVAGGAGSKDAGTCTVVVSGTSITDAGVRTTSDTETVIADVTAESLDNYSETTKKWLGQITYTLTLGGGASTCNFDFNYGFAKYDDFGNRDFTISDFECAGQGGASDTGFDIILYYHNTADWTYHATAFVPNTTVVAQLTTDYSTEQDLVSGEGFAYKRDNLTTAITGTNGEGYIIKMTIGANNSVENIDCHVGATIQ